MRYAISARLVGLALEMHATKRCGTQMPVDLNVIAFLTDLRHFCDFEGLNLAACDRIAEEQYIDELSNGPM